MTEIERQQPATVTILMGLCNGAEFLAAQLQSFSAQKHQDWRLIVSDDGSRDEGPAILSRFASECGPGQVRWQAGPCEGLAANYLSLLKSLPDEPGWIAFSDQDDVWLPERLLNGLECLAGIRGAAFAGAPVLATDRDLGRPRLSGGWSGETGFSHAIIQNIAQGNSLLFNPEAARLLVRAAKLSTVPVVHDWWAYQVVTGAGGQAVRDPRPALLYRQHSHNVIGRNAGMMAALRRGARLVSGKARAWNGVNIRAMRAVAPLLTPEALRILDDFEALHTARRMNHRWKIMRRLQLRRHSLAGSAALWIAALTGRV